MIDARLWRRPTPRELRDMIPPGLSQLDVAARLARPERVVRYWFQPEAPDARRIDYVEWLAFKTLCDEAAAQRVAAGT